MPLIGRLSRTLVTTTVRIRIGHRELSHNDRRRAWPATTSMTPRAFFTTEQTQNGKLSEPVPAIEDTPVTLERHAEKKGYLSVTDLVSPSWCEYAFHYGILGKRYLPVEQRPDEIVTPEGAIIKPDKQIAQQREKILIGGREVHEKLEREIHPVKVHVETTTREDEWALRFLRLIVGLRILLHGGTCRELPIFGMIGDHLIMGVVDEISRRPLSKSLNQFLDEANTKNTEAIITPTLQDFFSLQQSQDKSITATPTDGTKKWASQEEWKKERRKVEAAAKLNRKSPRKTTNKPKASNDAGQATLATFFGAQVDKAEVKGDASPAPSPARFGYFLEDSKTRMSRYLPSIDDQWSARLQCMLYKRLLDGLLMGRHTPAQTISNHSSESGLLELDEHAISLDPQALFQSLNLDQTAPLSDAFVRDAEVILQDYEIGIRSQDDPGTLNVMASLLTKTLDLWVQSAWEGLGGQGEAVAGIGALQDQLRLTYRQRGGGLRRKRHADQEIVRKQPPRRAKGNAQPVSTSEQAAETMPIPQVEKIGIGEDLQIAIALQMGLDDDVRQAELEDEILRDNGVVIPDSSPSKMSSTQATAATTTENGDSKDGTDAKKDKTILGRVDFYHHPYRLEEHVRDILQLWHGERQKRGVNVQQSWRCNRCEFRNDCQWRAEKGQELVSSTVARWTDRMAAEKEARNQEFGNDGEEGDSPHTPTRKEYIPLPRHDDAVTMDWIEQMVSATDRNKTVPASSETPQDTSKANLDDEDALWSQFEEPNEEVWKSQ